MQGIILCPNCRARARRDDIGELLCSNCSARLCPKAHIVDGKICQYCGWEDPNYYLWQKKQKAQPKSSEIEKSGQFLDGKPQQVCPKCGIVVEATSGRCSGCGWLYGGKPRVLQQPASSATSTPKSGPRHHTPLPYEPTRPAMRQSGAAPQSPLLHELRKVKHREWNFAPIKRFLQPVGASLLVCAVLFGTFILVKEVLIPVFRQPGGKTSSEIPPPPILNPAKLYALSAKVAPEGGGLIRITPPSESGTFESGVTVRLTAIPDECYTFSYWEGVTSESSEATVTVDSNKSITANFRLKDTTPPTISEVKVSRCSDISATITWNTDKPAKGLVEYGKTEAYGLSTSLDKEFATSHDVRIIGLQPNTTYYFKVKSQDKCGNENPQSTSTMKFATLSDIPVSNEVGKRPPDFTLQEYQDNRNPESPNNGETVSLNQYKGKKIMLNFWDTFCGACIGEFPIMRETYNKYAKNQKELILITVCIDGRADRIEKLEDKYKDAEDKYFGKVGNLTFPILLDVEEKTGKNYRISTIPNTIFIDSDGIIQHIKIGRFTSSEEIQTIINSLE